MERNAIEGGVSYNCCDTSLVKSCQRFLNEETQQKGFVTHILDVFLYFFVSCYAIFLIVLFSFNSISLQCGVCSSPNS